MRELAALLTMALVIIAFVVPAASADDLSGHWSGPVTQIDTKTPYSIKLTIAGTSGTSEYPELSCGGTLKKVAATRHYVIFTETITTGKGKCLDGIVTVARSGVGLGWNWFATADGKNWVAYAMLSAEK
jgi:hypothetical protein